MTKTKQIISIKIPPKLYESLNTFEVNLFESPWSNLLPDQILPFGIEEICRPNNVYPDGIYPGSVLTPGTNCVSTKINVFDNYLEWSKVTLDDVIEIDGEHHVTTKFFESRARGWAEEHYCPKPGDPIGFIFNGVAYHIQDIALVEDIVYSIVYKSLLAGLPQVIEMKQNYQEGYTIQLIGSLETGITLRTLADILNTGAE